MAKAIIFDFWGTIVENGVGSPSKELKLLLNIRCPFPEYIERMEKAMMTTHYPSLHTALSCVFREFKVPMDEELLQKAVGLWNKSWMLAKPYPESLEALEQLKKKYTIALVSSSDNISINNVLDKFKLRGYFHRAFLSYQMGIIKTDRNFYPTVLKELGVHSKDCMMIGDSLQSDVEAAKLVGINAILVDRKNLRDYHPRIDNLLHVERIAQSYD